MTSEDVNTQTPEVEGKRLPGGDNKVNLVITSEADVSEKYHKKINIFFLFY